ncbi:hypothetical protein OIU78_020379 [Salix suchowensis]|nr:hypothetical protein OIU78_020379 [Salix suchowensis]
MVVELMMAYRNSSFLVSKMEENAVEEAASGLEIANKLIRLLSQQNQENFHQSSTSTSRSTSMDVEMDCKAVPVSKFKKAISLLRRHRTGHARFRRAPVSTPPANQRQEQNYQVLEAGQAYYATPIQQIPPPVHNQNHHPTVVPKNGEIERKDSATIINFSYPSAGNSFVSSLTGDTDRKQPSSSSSFHITNFSQVSSAGEPPFTTSLNRKCSSENLDSAGKCASSGRCHCSKKRKMRLKRVVRVPSISLKMSDIPPDDYSWRKYGQKPIKGSPHPRGYYKCSSVRGCPARKHVERASDDPSMLVVTYEGEHSHTISVAETSNLILESS